MRFKKTFIFIPLVIFTLISLLNFENNTLKSFAAITASGSPATVNDYNGFYNTLNSAVKAHKSSLTVYAKGYNSSKYNLNKALQQITVNNFNLKYYVSSTHLNIKASKTSDKTLEIQLSYKFVDGVANNYKNFYAILCNASRAKKGSVMIKIHSTQNDVISKAFSVKNDINNVLPQSNQIYQIKMRYSKLANTNVILMVYTISYNNAASGSNSSISGKANNNQDLLNLVETAVKNCISTVNISLNNPALKKNQNLIYSTVDDTVYRVSEDLYGLDYVVSWDTYVNGSSVKIYLKYAYSKDQIMQRRNPFDKKVNKIMGSLIKPGMSDVSMELAMHDYIVKGSKYDEVDYLNGTASEDSYSAYGILVKGVGVCEGYANTMNAMLKMVGIQSMAISGQVYDGSQYVEHEWNLVKLGGSYYQVDTTWDDPIYTVNGKEQSILTYDYFNITDAKMAKDHKWDVSKYPKCTATAYKYTGK